MQTISSFLPFSGSSSETGSRQRSNIDRATTVFFSIVCGGVALNSFLNQNYYTTAASLTFSILIVKDYVQSGSNLTIKEFNNEFRKMQTKLDETEPKISISVQKAADLLSNWRKDFVPITEAIKLLKDAVIVENSRKQENSEIHARVDRAMTLVVQGEIALEHMLTELDEKV